MIFLIMIIVSRENNKLDLPGYINILHFFLLLLCFWHLTAMVVHDFPFTVNFFDQITKSGFNCSLVQVESVNSTPHNSIIGYWLGGLFVPLNWSYSVNFC